MNNPLLKMAGLTALVLCLHTSGFAQQGSASAGTTESDEYDTVPGRARSLDEIVIRHKGNKDAKVTIEIKNGEIFVNGKPASEYKDEDLSISKRRFKTLNGGAMAWSDGDQAMTLTPFRNYGGGAYSYDGRSPKARVATSGAFLGVTSIKSENGPSGAKIGEVSEGSAAEKAGLKEGDLITRVDDKTIESPEDLSKVIHTYKPGDKVTITYKRDGKDQKATAELGRSRTQTYAYGFGDNGSFNWNSDDMARVMPRAFKIAPRGNFYFGDNSMRLGIRAQDTEDGKGVKVLDVDDETVAAKAGVKEDDIITKFDGQEVNSATRLAELARAAREDKTRQNIKINLLRNGKPMELELKVPRKLKTADL